MTTLTDEVARFVAAEAIWAPSVHNTQPWWFSTGQQQLSLHADDSRQLSVADPAGREMMINCGAALFTVRLALRSLGYIPETSVLPDPAEPHLVAHVSWRQRAAAAPPGSPRRDGVPATLHSQPLELGWLREFLRTQTSDPGYPQLILRLGTVTQMAASVRRAADDVLYPLDGEHVTIRHG